jgi:shikimate kinase
VISAVYMLISINKKWVFLKREREEVVKKNEHDSSKPLLAKVESNTLR